MDPRPHILRFAAAILLLALCACGGGGDGGAGTPPSATSIGAAGGTVTGPNGAMVVIPPGALATDTSIAIEQTTAGSPTLPGTFTAAGAMFAFTPHGTTFAVPVTVTLPFDPASVPAGSAPALFKTNPSNQWEQVAGATFGSGNVSAPVTGFSFVQVGGLLRDDPKRVWAFTTSNGFKETRIDGDTLIGGELDVIAEFGAANFDEPVIRLHETLPPDGKANGQIFSTASGVTYGVSAEAPDGKVGGPDPIGSASRLTQTQSFIKVSDDATMQFTVTSVIVELKDFRFALPPGLAVTAMRGEATLAVSATKTTETNPFFHSSGRAGIYGARGFFIPRAEDESFSRSHLWSRLDDFDFVTEDVTYTVGVGPTTGVCHGTRVALTFKHPHTYVVNLSAVKKFEEFTLRTDAYAETLNGRGGGAAGDCEATSIRVSLRDPLEVGGSTLSFSGLQPTNRPADVPPPGAVLVPPAACVPGPGPVAEAGVLQFDAASYSVDEFAAAPVITVTRTGGSSGAVTATFTTNDGSAIGGTDYAPLNVTVFFADGDASPRVVSVPIINDQVDEIDKTVNLTLSQPGGCAALGAQTTAVLTIRDDDAPAAQPSGLDTTFGIAGKADSTERGGAATAFGGDRSSMALQDDGKIVMVGGTFSDFILARFNADGSLDTGFGVDGKVRTDMGSGLRPEEALAVAIQPDGKIVVVGYTGIDVAPPANDPPLTFALARYNADGSLDTAFGAGGRVSGNVNGIAYAVAIQGDGKIVLAGEFAPAVTNGVDFSDVAVARFNANGSLDASFGVGGTGQVTTDVGNATNSARNLVLQPNGAIVVSGKPAGNSAGFDHTDVLRYNTNGSLDTSFGSGGKLAIAGADVGEGLVRQPDGRLVLAGSVTEATVPATARFLLKRLNANGSLDTTFGNAGTVDTAFAVNAAARAVALQGDGKIVAVGTTAFSVNSNFVVARYAVDGSIDRAFGSDGNLSIDFFGFSDVGESVLVQRDGKIVVGGQARHNFDGYGMARINP